MAITDVKDGQILISDISGDGVVNIDISKYIYKYNAKQYPFTTLIEAKNKPEPALTKEFKFNILGELNRTCTITGGGPTTYTTADTSMLQVGCIVAVPAGGTATSASLYSGRVVTAVTANTSFVINATFGDTLVNTDKVYVMSYAAGEGSKSPTSLLPSTAQGLNYVQQFKRAIEMSNDLIKERKYFNLEALYRMAQLGEYKQDMELGMLFNVGQKVAVDAESKPIYTMQGFWSALQDPTNATFPFYSSNEKQTDSAELPGLLADGSNFTRSIFNAFLQDAMTYGSNEKILMVDSWLMGKISDFGDGYFRTERNKKMMLNVEVTEVLVPGKGVVNIVYNPCFEKGLTFKGGILIDPANVKKRVYRPTAVEYSIQENDRDGKKDQILGSYSIEWAKLETHGFLTHL